MKRLLEPIESPYDFVFIDAGPSLGDHMINALVYVDEVIVPVDMGDLALDALVRFVEFVDATREEGHTDAKITGILLTMKDGRETRYERDVAAGLRAEYGELVFDTAIHRRVKIKEISAMGINLNEPAMGDYFALAEEIIERINRKEAI